ncbi:MAG TPA: response regulator [Candidatus Thermoplasmatota archaeon]|nr:response regulator [Candidatus Thermoplasmatota archaeon]
MKALIVDDSATDALLMAKALESCAEIELATSGRDALAKLRNHPYDLVVLDYFLGDMTGPELMMKLKARPEGAPVLFVSGRSNESNVAQAMALGAFDFVLKGTPDFVQDLRGAAKTALATLPPNPRDQATRRLPVAKVLVKILDRWLAENEEVNVAAVIGNDWFLLRSRVKVPEPATSTVVKIAQQVHEALDRSAKHLGYVEGRCTIASYNQGLLGLAPMIAGGDVLLATNAPETPLEEFRASLERLAAEVGKAIGEGTASTASGPPPPEETSTH